MTRTALPLLLLLGLCACVEPTATAPTAPPVTAAAPPPARPAGAQAGAPALTPASAPAATATAPVAAVATGAPAPLAGGLPPPPPVASAPLDATPAAAVAPAEPAAAAGAAGQLGTTVASLGPPAESGLWLETPLVTAPTQGRVEDPATGRTITVELRPSGGEPGSGSQISLEAMRELGLPLTGLPELNVYGA